VLFDIDATLLTTRGQGIRALRRAGADVFGEPFEVEHVESSGRLDPLIMLDMIEAARKRATEARLEEFRAAYLRRLDETLVPGVAGALPGVPALLEALGRIDEMVVGLVTGNLPETGLLKLERAGIDARQFEIRAWGCDSPHEPPARDHLPGVALERFLARHRREADRSVTSIVGDTPHDVACAKAHGLRCLGVSTGLFDGCSLEEAGADLVLDDLTQTDEIVQWLTKPLRR